MIHVATPEENQARLEFRFVRDECHVRLYLFRCVLCRFCADFSGKSLTLRICAGLV
jgi:hypothetical protein